MALQHILIANRGEIALRIMRTAADLGIETLAVYTEEDADGLHVRRADQACRIPGYGARAYLDAAAFVDIALGHACDAVHPGYGFLAEHAGFAHACEAAGLVFVGPTPEQLSLFGNKIEARQLARRCGIPVIEGSPVLDGPDAAEACRDDLGRDATIVIKAAAGGGGRGMRVVAPEQDIAAAWAQCTAEAETAFGDGSVYAELYLGNARHVEVQILGDGTGAVTHLWERDCSLQRRHQKLIEVAPAPNLAESLRRRLLDAALEVAGAVAYRGLGTFEFLLDLDAGREYFIEANPRLQVEHTVTEEVLGVDLVALQLAVAAGRTLQNLGYAAPPPAPAGYAIELRINAERMDAQGGPLPTDGIIERFEPATGPGVRVDTAVHAGYAVNSNYDPLIAKLIVHTRADDFGSALTRAARVAAEFILEGPDTNLGMLRALVTHPELASGELRTSFVDAHAGGLFEAAAAFGQAQTSAAPWQLAIETRLIEAGPDGTVPMVAPLRGSVVSIDVDVGARVQRGEQVALLEAMKMHHAVGASVTGTVAEITAHTGLTLAEGQPLMFVVPEGDAGEVQTDVTHIDLDTRRADLDEVQARHALGLDAGRPEAVAKRRKIGCRTARENVEDLCDPDSFIEYGALAIAAQRRRRTLEDLMTATPADGLVAGIGTVNADEFGVDTARCAVLAYDYTVLAGTQGHTNHKKKDRLFELAVEWELPVVFFTEGGGGRPGDVDTDDLIMSWLDISTFSTWPSLSGIAPRIAINSGRCFAGNAAIFGCADITIATANSNIGLGGPAMIEGGGLGRFAPDDIGPMDVQTANGVVDIAVKDEAEATAVGRQVLGCFQGVTREWSCSDQRRLRHSVPEDRLRVYDVRKVITDLADEGSVVELRRAYGVGLITALIRIEGRPFGLIANDPRHLGGAIDSEGGEKGARFLQLCDAYGLPVVSLCDTPGFMVGPDSEKTAAVRRGSRLIVASANLGVPLFVVVLRKGYGLGAQAMAGGGLHRPFFTIAWPTAEFGPMGREGAVVLGLQKELEAAADPQTRQTLYDELVAGMYEKGNAVSVASGFEIDAVIDPAETRAWLVKGLRAAGPRSPKHRRFVDVW
jgi:acetyl/propionyl-CoA carboxylase alpha subunit